MSIDKDFEDFFRERLEGLEETPPANGWEKIRKDINVKPWYQKVNWLAAVALLCLLSVAVYFGARLADGPEQIAATQQAEPETVTSGQEAAKPATTRVAAPDLAKAPASPLQTQATEMAPGADPAIAAAPQPAGTFSAQNPTVSIPESQVNGQPELLIASGKTKKAKATQKETASAEPVGGLTASATSTTRQNKSETGGIAAGLTAQNRYTLKGKNYPANTKVSPQPVEAETMVTRQANTAATPEVPSQNLTAKTASGQPAQTLNPEIALLTVRVSGIFADSPEIPEMLPFLPVALAPDSAGTSENQIKPVPLWSVSGFVSPRSTFSKYSANHSDGKLIRDMSKTTTTLSDVLSYETGLTLHRGLTDRLTLDAGLAYTALKDEVHYQISTGEVKSVSVKSTSQQGAAVDVEYNFVNESIKTRYNYAGLKLGVSYTVAQRDKTRFYANGGGIMQVLVSSQTQVYRNGALVNNSLTALSADPMQKLNGQLYGSFGMARQFDAKWHVFAEPGFGYFLGSALGKQEVLQLKPVTFGFNFGLRYDL